MYNELDWLLGVEKEGMCAHFACDFRDFTPTPPSVSTARFITYVPCLFIDISVLTSSQT